MFQNMMAWRRRENIDGVRDSFVYGEHELVCVLRWRCRRLSAEDKRSAAALLAAAERSNAQCLQLSVGESAWKHAV